MMRLSIMLLLICGVGAASDAPKAALRTQEAIYIINIPIYKSDRLRIVFSYRLTVEPNTSASLSIQSEQREMLRLTTKEAQELAITLKELSDVTQNISLSGSVGQGGINFEYHAEDGNKTVEILSSTSSNKILLENADIAGFIDHFSFVDDQYFSWIEEALSLAQIGLKNEQEWREESFEVNIPIEKQHNQNTHLLSFVNPNTIKDFPYLTATVFSSKDNSVLILMNIAGKGSLNAGAFGIYLSEKSLAKAISLNPISSQQLGLAIKSIITGTTTEKRGRFGRDDSCEYFYDDSDREPKLTITVLDSKRTIVFQGQETISYVMDICSRAPEETIDVIETLLASILPAISSASGESSYRNGGGNDRINNEEIPGEELNSREVKKGAKTKNVDAGSSENNSRSSRVNQAWTAVKTRLEQSNNRGDKVFSIVLMPESWTAEPKVGFNFVVAYEMRDYIQYFPPRAVIQEVVYAAQEELSKEGLLPDNTMIRVRAQYAGSKNNRIQTFGKAHAEVNSVAVGHISFDSSWWDWKDGE